MGRERGNFRIKNGNYNDYECIDCIRIEHEVIQINHDVTDKSSCWGAGIPTTRRECTNCKKWDGPWVSVDIVGGGY